MPKLPSYTTSLHDVHCTKDLPVGMWQNLACHIAAKVQKSIMKMNSTTTILHGFAKEKAFYLLQINP